MISDEWAAAIEANRRTQAAFADEVRVRAREIFAASFTDPVLHRRVVLLSNVLEQYLDDGEAVAVAVCELLAVQELDPQAQVPSSSPGWAAYGRSVPGSSVTDPVYPPVPEGGGL